MITRIYARGFKGMDFDQSLALRTVITGRIGSGKSSRALALALLVTGSLPGTGIAKSNSDILNAVGNGDSLTVGLEFDDGVTLERSYKRKKNGAVGCEYRNAGESVPKNLFELELDRRGVSIADVSAFLALSDAKKVDELFRLFPPAGDVRGLGTAITRAKERISELESAIKGKEQSCRSITESLASLNLPSGSLPEVQATIVQTEHAYQAARDELTRERARLEQVQVRSVSIHSRPIRRLTPQPTDRGRADCPSLQGGGMEKDFIGSADLSTALFPLKGEVSNHKGIFDEQDNTRSTFAHGPGVAVAALERVLSALRRAGCEGCAAQMVLRRELKQLRTEATNG